jgi:hypothetical protein
VVHDGSVLASGIAIDTLLVGETEARARIIRLSEASAAGSAAFRVGSALMLRLPAPTRIDCVASLGTPLVRYGRLLSAAPLAADEEKALASFDDAVVLVAGGVATATPLKDDVREDISQWIDVSEFRVVDGVLPLGRTAFEAPREQLIASVVDVRRSLGMAPLDKAGGELLAALGQPMVQTSGAARPSRGSWLARLAGGFAAVRNAWRAGRRPAGAGASPSAASTSQRQSGGAPRRGGLRDFLARALWSSRLANLIGRQHARYLSRMLAMFDDGDLDAALRHAIPLGKGLDLSRLRLPLWTPAPRDDLSITPRQQLASTSLGVGNDLFSYLRQRYRQAFERLAAAGEIEKAAFVLAELLDASEEAVLFLERHGRLRLAAEIAETRNLPAGLVIRQWFLAGERARAIAIARRTGAFADAVVRLESSHREQATVLRLLWADALASGGLYAAAVDAAWPVEAARNLALAWIDRAIEIGGATGGRMLARKARVRPEEFADIRERALALLADEGEDARGSVTAFAQELTVGDPIGETRILARAAARRLLHHRDEAAGEGLLNGLVRVSGDTVFQADVRSLRKRTAAASTAVPLRLRHEPLEISRQAADRGAIAVCDAAQMPDGRMLVAAGEVGAWLLSREGKMLARFAEPTSRIVASDHGDRAILTAMRGEVCRLSRLDLLERRVQPWCDARIDRFAPDFDGLTWFVARGGTLYAVDATAARFEHLWKVDEAGAVVREVRRSATSMSAWFEWLPSKTPQRQTRPPEVWTYELPSLTLRRRQPVEASDETPSVTAIGPEGDAAGWTAGADTETGRPQPTKAWCLPRNGNRKDALEAPRTGDVLAWSDPPCLTSEWALVPVRERGRVLLHLLDMPALQVRARISLEGEMQTMGARFQGDRLIVFDSYGRVLVVSLTSGAVVREYRL